MFFNSLKEQGQETYYLIEDNLVKTQSYSQIKQELLFQKIAETKSLKGFVLTTVIKEGLKILPSLFYKPEKFIKEYGIGKSFINKEKLALEDISTYKGMSYEKKGDDKILTQLNFSLIPLFDSKNGYTIIQLDSFRHNRSAVKLKKGNKGQQKVNMRISLGFKYFDSNNLSREYKIAPLIIKGISPGKQYELGTEVPLQLIPPMNVIQEVEVRITEVNMRKKYWDKLLKVYDDNREKIEGTILKIIEEKEKAS